MQAVDNIENTTIAFESQFSPAQMRALRRRAKRVHAGARSSTDILNALAARVERNPSAVLRDATPAELH